MATSRAERLVPPASTEVPLSESPFASNGNGSITAEDIREAAPAPGKSKPETELIIEALQRIYVGMGVGLAFLPSMAPDGMIIASSADDLAESWRDLLDNDPKVRRMLRKLLKSSAWGAVITAHMAVAIAVAKNHPDGIQHLIRRRSSESVSSE